MRSCSVKYKVVDGNVFRGDLLLYWVKEDGSFGGDIVGGGGCIETGCGTVDIGRLI